MSSSPNLSLPFVQAAQAQKHVTVNEAIQTLDVLVQLSVKDMTLTAPPGTPAEGDRHVVATGATGAWAGQDGNVAVWQDGAWAFLIPRVGWLVWDEAAQAQRVHDGTLWQNGPSEAQLARSPRDATTVCRIVEAEHTLSAGATSDTSLLIPDRAVVIGVTGRVTEAITGASTWDLGVAADTARYGNGIGAALDSTVNGVSGTPVAYYAPTPLRLTADGGSFTGGKVRLAIHFMALGIASS